MSADTPDAQREKIIEFIKELENSKNIRFNRLIVIGEAVFGPYRTAGSHHIFKMPWAGNPRVNLQRDGADAKPYQVKQFLSALKKLVDAEYVDD
jgi:hypothetical protein